MVTRASVVAATLACVLITCAADLDLDHTEHHSPTIELGTPQARTDTALQAEFSGRAKESATDAVALCLSLPPSLSFLSHYLSLSSLRSCIAHALLNLACRLLPV